MSRSRLFVIALGALLGLRCSSFGADNGPSAPADDAGASSSGDADAAPIDPDDDDDGEGIVTETQDTTLLCSEEGALIVGSNGDAGIAAKDDTVVPLAVDAYSYVVASSLLARCAHLFVRTRGASNNGAPDLGTIGVRFGVYTNARGGLRPSHLVAQATFADVVEGNNVAPLDKAFSAPLNARLWIGIVPTSSQLTLVVDRDEDCTSAQGGLHPHTVQTPTLPELWGNGDTDKIEPDVCNARFFVSQ